MAMNEIMHGPAQAAANFLDDVQAKIQLLMHVKGVSRASLAAALGISASRVTQMLRSDANVTLETLARVFVALGERPEITSVGIKKALAAISYTSGDSVFGLDSHVEEDTSDMNSSQSGPTAIDWSSLFGRSIEVDTLANVAVRELDDDEATQELPMAA